MVFQGQPLRYNLRPVFEGLILHKDGSFDPNLSTAIVKIIETLFYTNNEKKSMT